MIISGLQMDALKQFQKRHEHSLQSIPKTT